MNKPNRGRNLPNGELWNNKAWRDVRKRAIQTKDPYCAICGKFIDTTLPAFDPLACEADHIIPISRGGAPYELSNIQLTHSRCNRKKGAKMDDDLGGKVFENPFPISNSW